MQRDIDIDLDGIPGGPEELAAATAYDPRVSFTITLARALHRFGTPTHRLEETMHRLFERLGLIGSLFAIPTGIFASFGPPEAHKTSLIRTSTPETNLEKLSRLDELAEEVIRGRVTAEEGAYRVEQIVAAPSRYPVLLDIICYSISSGAAARFFGGGWREILCAAAIGLAIGCTALMLRSSENLRRLFELAAAVLAGFIATAATAAVAPLSSYVTTLAGLIALIPGLTLTTAMTEIATGNLVSGTARLTGAALTFLELGFGVALGERLAQAAVSGVHHAAPEPMVRWSIWIALVAAPLAFTVLMRARPRDVGWIMAACAVGFGGARFGTWLLGPELGAFMGACALGIAGNLFARVVKRPAAVPLLPGLILLVPGSIGLGSLAKFIQRDVMSGVEAAFEVTIVAVGLVIGLLLANVVVSPRRTL
ncbi:MAG: threonine/serine exporter family protein [Bacteroidetes bacterium]|nr:threonine/serine exporter family protein [Bacteroidota bacterium]